MGIVKLIKQSTLASSIVFVGATVGTVGIMGGTALAKPPTKSPTTVVVLVDSPVNTNVASVSNVTFQNASSGSNVVGAVGLFSSTNNTGTDVTGSVTNTNTTTITVNQTNY